MEVGRTAPEELPERRSSQTPWGIYSAPRPGSTRHFGSAAAGMTSSAGGPGRGFELGLPSAFSGRASRLTTASPLQGRSQPVPLSQRISIISTPGRRRLAISSGLGEDYDMLGGEIPLLEGESEDFQLCGPSAAVDTQTAAQSQWLAAALDSESRNFLVFVDAQMQAKEPMVLEEQQDGGWGPRQAVTFEDLLPSTQHTRMVAAQAFLHILTLASKSLVIVSQHEGFGDIEIAIVVEP
jgi:meiotic recombination protein REC8, fungi type